MAQPPLQTASADDRTSLRHPVPDVLPRQGPFAGNIDTLEQSAERLSLNSRAGDAIYRLNQDLKRRDSRASAQRSAPTSRQGSLGSFHNGFTRWDAPIGGGGNGGTISPRRSIRSHSSSHVSNARYAAVTQLTGPQMAGNESESEDDSPPPKPSSIRTTLSSLRSSIRGASGQYTPLEDQTEWAEHETNLPRASYSMAEGEGHTTNDPQRSRSGSNASTRTYQPSLFKDFDGVHYSSILEEEESEERDQFDVYGHHQDQQPQKRHTWLEPPPDTGMVYYPAPVPQLLNLPKRLSMQPPPAVHSKRRSQVLSTIPGPARMSVQPPVPDEERHSVLEEGPEPVEDDPRASVQPAKRESAIPAHLRAGVFFERPSIPHHLQVRDESAVATLDTFLNASASTPASAFTDHPIVGNILDVYAKEKSKDGKRRSTMNALQEAKLDPRKSRSMLAGSRMSLQNLGRLRLRGSKGNLLEDMPYAMDRDADYESDMEDDADRAAIGRSPLVYDDDQYEGADSDDRDEAGDDDHDEDEDRRALGPPTTLLAELQMRKAELRQRNRTAVQAFPNGMHATLLELDAVAQIEKKRRRGQRTALAWEDPSTLAIAAEQEGGGNDDVPLGVLFPPKNRLINRVGADDWDRPLGLIEQKFREDNEPLSVRRNRLRGIPDEPVPPNIPQDSQSEASEHEGETLAERTRRLKTMEALNSALPDHGRPTSADFASELRSQLGVEEPPAPAPEPSPPRDNPSPPKLDPTPDPEETLGQRRRRLQAEGKARAAPPLVARTSMSNLLAANPGIVVPNALQTPYKHDPIRQGGLLSLSAQQQAQQRQDLLKHNMGLRIPSTESQRHLSAATAAADPVAANGLLGLHAQQRDYQRELAFEQMRQQTAMYGAPNLPQYQQQLDAQAHFHNSMNYNNMNLLAAGVNPATLPFHAQPALMPNVMPNMMPMGFGQQVNVNGHGGVATVYPQATGSVFPGAPTTMGMEFAGPMDDGQRDAIESWRQSVL